MCLAHLSECGVVDGIQGDGALVGEVVEEVEGPGRLRAPLLVAEHQVYPLVQLARHRVTLQGLRTQKQPIREPERRATPQGLGVKSELIIIKICLICVCLICVVICVDAKCSKTFYSRQNCIKKNHSCFINKCDIKRQVI